MKKIKSVLITLPKPDTEKSPYYELAKKYNLKVDFKPFIHVEGIPAKELDKGTIHLGEFTAVILTSRNAVDHFFRVCDELRVEMPADMKYFCLSETIGLYLQKYIQYRKRKVFYGKQGTTSSLPELLKKHASESFLYPCSDVAAEETQKFLQENHYDFKTAVLFKTVCSDISDLSDVYYDIIAFFSPSSIQSLFKNFPQFKQNDTKIAAFGASTHKAAQEHNLILDIPAPTPNAPSMTMAIEQYVKNVNK